MKQIRILKTADGDEINFAILNDKTRTKAYFYYGETEFSFSIPREMLCDENSTRRLSKRYIKMLDLLMINLYNFE